MSTSMSETTIPAHLWTTKQAAKAMGIDVIAVTQMVQKGMLPATRFGRRFAIDPADIAPLVEQLVSTRQAIGNVRNWRHRELSDLEAEVERLRGQLLRLEAQVERKRRPVVGRGVSIPPKLRFAVFARDGHACRYCGARPPAVILHADHVIPVIAGGSTTEENLVTACATCNLGKGRHPATPPELP